MKTTNSILQDVENTLYTAEIGFEMYKSDIHRRRVAGLRNVAVFGRSVTFAIQNLRTTIGEEFDTWYLPKMEEMKADKVFSYLNTVRTDIIHEGKMNLLGSYEASGDIMTLIAKLPRPPRAKGWFIGDPNLGSGWEVETENGKIENFLIDIPDKTEDFELKVTLHFADAPQQLIGENIQELLDHYLIYLRGLVKEANQKFRE